jgi:hypothetical protein
LLGDIIGIPEGTSIRITNSYQRVAFDAYVLCTTIFGGKIPPHFGKHTVIINKPIRFFRELTNALQVAADIRHAYVGPVRYGWDHEFSGELPTPEEVCFSKPSQFAPEREARGVWAPPPSTEIVPLKISCSTLSSYLEALPELTRAEMKKHTDVGANTAKRSSVHPPNRSRALTM